jgi:hypothetical protein
MLRLHACQAVGLQQQWGIRSLAMTGIEAAKPSQKRYEENLSHIIYFGCIVPLKTQTIGSIL